MCSSSVTELSLSHAGLRQDYKRWTAMCSKSSYLPSLEGMPCKIWLAARSILSIDFEGLFYWRGERLSVAVLTVTCWLPHVPDPSPAPGSAHSSRRGALVARAAHQGIWPAGCVQNGITEAKQPRTVITADGGSVAFNIKTDATSLFHLSGTWTWDRMNCLPNN